MVLKGQEESESSSSRNFLSRFCSLQQNVNESVLLFFSQRTLKRKKTFSHKETCTHGLVVGHRQKNRHSVQQCPHQYVHQAF